MHGHWLMKAELSRHINISLWKRFSQPVIYRGIFERCTKPDAAKAEMHRQTLRCNTVNKSQICTASDLETDGPVSTIARPTRNHWLKPCSYVYHCMRIGRYRVSHRWNRFPVFRATRSAVLHGRALRFLRTCHFVDNRGGCFDRVLLPRVHGWTVVYTAARCEVIYYRRTCEWRI